MLLRATLLAAFGLFALPASAQNIDARDIITPTVSSIAFNNGNIGGNCEGDQMAFVFNSDEGLCSSGFLVGFAEDNVVGNSYFLTDETEWTPGDPIVDATEFPYADFPSGFTMFYGNAENGLTVAHTVYFGTVYPDVVLHQFDVTSADAVDGVYMGLHHDWDVGGAVFASNEAGRDGSTLYAFDPTGATDNVFGVALLNVELSGWGYETTFAGGGQTNEIVEADLWNGMTMPAADSSPALDQRLTSGAGPYTFAAGGTQRLLIGYGAGEDLTDLLQNIADLATVVVADESGPQAASAALSAPRPNPATGTARVAVSLDAAESVRVSVYDVLGRQVTTVHQGALAAGSTDLTVSLDGLAPGLYVVLAEGETFRQTRTLTVAR